MRARAPRTNGSGPWPAAACAGTSSYCGGWLGAAPAYCYGAQRTLYAVEGSGDQHSVCVGVSQGGNVTCSSGPGAGTYNALGVTASFIPWINNQGGSANLVHGTAYQP
jgi:hypothetical protein